MKAVAIAGGPRGTQMLAFYDFEPVEPVRVRVAWERMAETGNIAPDLLRPHVPRAWARSIAAECSPRALPASRLSPEETLELLHDEEPLRAAARPFLAALSRAAGGEAHAAMLGDREGRVLDVVGDEETVYGPGSVPGPGSVLSERAAGANGLGTPLAENRYIELVGPEHFVEAFQGYTCQGIPLAGTDGRPSGVLCIYVRKQETARRVRNILLCARCAIESELLAQRLSEGLWHVRRVSGAEQTLAKLHQDIAQLRAAARLRFETAASLLAKGRSADEFVGLAEELSRRFRRRADLWGGLVDETVGAPQPLRLVDVVTNLVELLETEAAISGVELTVGNTDSAMVMADHRSISRKVFEKLADTLATVGRGSRIRVDVRADAARKWVTASLDAVRGSGISVSRVLVRERAC
jgi:sigma-54 dependent transcriptional regulator, acetoin dehydrogenase operon transcriptional activator AcoR